MIDNVILFPKIIPSDDDIKQAVKDIFNDILSNFNRSSQINIISGCFLTYFANEDNQELINDEIIMFLMYASLDKLINALKESYNMEILDN